MVFGVKGLEPLTYQSQTGYATICATRRFKRGKHDLKLLLE
jgi:hypothetical protein